MKDKTDITLRVTCGGIEPGEVLKYRTEVYVDGAYYKDGDAMMELFSQHISLKECATKFGVAPAMKDSVGDPYIRLGHLPCFYDTWLGEAEPILYFRWADNGYGVIEANRAELLIPFIIESRNVGTKAVKRSSYRLPELYDNDDILLGLEDEPWDFVPAEKFADESNEKM